MNATKCEEIRNLLSDYLDNDLDEKTRKEVEGHLSTCSNCAKELELLRKAMQLVKAWPDLDSREFPDFERKLEEQIAKEQKLKSNVLVSSKNILRQLLPERGSFMRRFAVPSLAAAMLLMAIVISYIFITCQGPSIPTTPTTYSKGLMETRVFTQNEFLAGAKASVRLIAVNYKTEEPIKNADVKIFLREKVTEKVPKPKEQLVWKGVTDNSGTVSCSFSMPDLPEGTYEMMFMTESGRDNSSLITHEVHLKKTYAIYLTTDKPLYQPNQMIHIRALALKRHNLTPISDSNITLEVEDSKGNKVMKNAIKTNKFGIASAEFQLADEINMGLYTIRAILTNPGTDPAKPDTTNVEKKVTVDKYTLPKMKLTLKTDKDYYHPKDAVKLNLKSDYIFGKPVPSAKVEIKAETFDVRFQEFFNNSNKPGKTDEKGAYEIEIKLPDYFVGQPLLQGKGLVKFTAILTDEANVKQEVTATTTVSEGDVVIHVLPEGGAVKPKLDNIVYIVTAYPDGTPTSANVDVEFTISGKPKKYSISTDKLGIGKFSIRPETLEATKLSLSAVDQKGNKGTRTYDLASIPDEEGLVLIIDKAIKKVGDMLYLNVASTRQEGTVYVDILRNKQTILTTDLELKKGKGELALEVTAEMFGLVEINAYQIRRSLATIRDTKRLFIQPANDLNIAISLDKQLYAPGDPATVNFQVRDSKGHPVLAALGIFIVDEAVFAKSELQPGLEKVFFYLEEEIMKPRIEVHGFDPTDLVHDIEEEPKEDKGMQFAQKEEAARVIFASVEIIDPYPTKISSREQEIVRELVNAYKNISNAIKKYIDSKRGGISIEKLQVEYPRIKKVIEDGMQKYFDSKYGKDTYNKLKADHNHIHKLVQDGVKKYFDSKYGKDAYDKLKADHTKIWAAIPRYWQYFQEKKLENKDENYVKGDMKALIKSKILKKEDLLDPWGSRYSSITDFCGCWPNGPHELQLVSNGPDKKKGTGDDLVVYPGPRIQTGMHLKLSDLLDEKIIDEKDLLDPWGTRYEVTPLEPLDQGINTLSTYGPDKKKGTEDDAIIYPGPRIESKLPINLDNFIKEKFINAKDLLDPWGSRYEITAYRGQEHIDILSYGPDRRKGNVDDVIIRYGHVETHPPYLTIDEVTQAKFLTRGDLIDPWGKPYEVSPRYRWDQGINLLTAGIDGIKGTQDDLSLPYGFEKLKNDLKNKGFFPGAEGVELNELADELNKELEDFEETQGKRAEMKKERWGARGAQGAPKAPSSMVKPPDDRALKADSGDISGGGGEAGAPKPRLRQFFPETLFATASLITDENGRASVKLSTVADAITTYRTTTMANSLAGQLGSTEKPIRVFQDFFADLDLPVYLTQNDETSIPIQVRNYTNKSQKVTVSLKEDKWFEALSEEKIIVDVEAGHSKGISFRIQAQKVGRHPIEIKAEGEKVADWLVREIDVIPDGREFIVNYSDVLTSERGKKIKHTIAIPEGAIDDASTILVKVYPGFFSQVVEGMDKILRMPSGCFEQTSSSAYPNVLVMDYVKRSSQRLSPERKMQAEAFLLAGYQRLLTFERPGGGFDWWGRDPALVYLTAYGVMEFNDMKRVLPGVDYGVIDRATGFLFKEQDPDGGWSKAGGTHGLRIDRDPKIALTAYVIWGILEGGVSPSDERVKKAIDYIRKNYDKTEDPYHLGLCANALLSANTQDEDGIKILEKLNSLKVEDGRKVYWKSNNSIYSSGDGANVETTGMVVLAFLKAKKNINMINQALEWLISVKDPHGTWGSTQATILALKALIQAAPGNPGATNAEITLWLNGKQWQKPFVVTADNSDVMQQLNLKPEVIKGDNEVELSFGGEGAMMYQIVGRYYLPWGERPVEREPFTISVDYDRSKLATEDLVKATIGITNNQPSPARMVMLDVGIPPGFKVISTDLDDLVEKKKIVKYSITSRQVIIYLESLGAGETLELTYRLQAKYPVKARSQASKAYEYYAPEKQGFAPPKRFEVK